MVLPAAAPATGPVVDPPVAASGGSSVSVGFLADDLAAHDERTAVVTDSGTLTYRELAERVRTAADQLGGGRRLVLLAGSNTVDGLVQYLGALTAGHVVCLLPPDRVDASDVVAAYEPDVVVRPAAQRPVDHRHPEPRHALHPDLALLLSTSGSTGSPKLVRLSYENLRSNAAAIATSLGVRPDDRAVTSLPLHYCYGLSVVHTHLLRGAALVLTDRSVVDPAFWELVRSSGATTLAGVPYTFDLLDRCGFETMDLPRLRYVTQAGGRLAPERVRQYARLGRRRGWDLVVMYGQTEATARMATLPPDHAESSPQAIGLPIPGGSFRLARVDGTPEGVGELVYTGPNVMLGYAHGPQDLARGRDVTELRTGDLARRGEDGLYEIVGRASRYAKVVGLRIDLLHLEERLTGRGVRAACVEGEGRLLVAVEAGAPDLVRRHAGDLTGLPPHLVSVVAVDALPRVANGKVDLPAVRALVEAVETAPGLRPAHADVARALREAYAEVLGRRAVTGDDTFAGLGGDSLSYVELSVRIEEVLGHLPSDWHTTRIGDLQPRPGRRRRLGRDVDMSVLLRAVAIVLIVGSHANTFMLEGGAHLLIAVAGYNFARFHLTARPRLERVRHVLRSAACVAVPSMVVIAGVAAVVDGYEPANLVLLNSVFGTGTIGRPWQYWFVECLVQTLVLLALLLSVPSVDRWQRRAPFGVVAALFALALVFRVGPVDLGDGPASIQSTPAVLWLFVLGWGAAAALRGWQRCAVAVAAVLSVPGFFDNPKRENLLLAGILLLLAVRSVAVPRPIAWAAAVLAANSLYIYLTHWQVFPHLQDQFPVLATLSSLAVGIAVGAVARPAIAGLSRRSRISRRRRVAARAVRLPGPVATDGLPRRRRAARRIDAGVR